jgi:hypothetical protein
MLVQLIREQFQPVAGERFDSQAVAQGVFDALKQLGV